jgi:acetyl esterase/lipase
MKRLLFTFVFLLPFILFGCGQEDQPGQAPKAPRGYPNETILKIAYGLGFVELVETNPDIPESIEVVRDMVYKQVDSISLKLDVYREKDFSTPGPALVFIHGGGWSKGDKSDYLPYLIDYAKKGYVTVTVSYRLSKVAHFPAAVEDIHDAVQWVRVHAGELLINPEKIALIGGSAGGHLAMMQAFSDTTGSKVQAVVNIYGPTDLTTEYARNRGECLQFLGKSYAEAPELYRAASPRTYISADDPPTLTFHGTIDSLVPVSQSDSLHKWLERAGVPNEYHRLKGWPHTMDLSRKVNDYCQYYMDAFFRKHLQVE